MHTLYRCPNLECNKASCFLYCQFLANDATCCINCVVEQSNKNPTKWFIIDTSDNYGKNSGCTGIDNKDEMHDCSIPIVHAGKMYKYCENQEQYKIALNKMLIENNPN